MSLFHGKDVQLGYILADVVISGAATQVLGGALTASTTFDSDGSGLLTFDPFAQPPRVICFASSGAGTTTAVNGQLTTTGVTVSNCYLRNGPSPLSGLQVSVLLLGLQKL